MRTSIGKRSADKKQNTKVRKKQKKKAIKLKVLKTHKPEDIGLEEWQRILRKQFAEQQKFKLQNSGAHPIILRVFADKSGN